MGIFDDEKTMEEIIYVLREERKERKRKLQEGVHPLALKYNMKVYEPDEHGYYVITRDPVAWCPACGKVVHGIGDCEHVKFHPRYLFSRYEWFFRLLKREEKQ